MGDGEKVRENRLRRWADRLGLSLRKSRARHWHFDDRGGYRIIDAFHNVIEAGEKFDLDLDDVEAFLEAREKDLARGDR